MSERINSYHPRNSPVRWERVAGEVRRTMARAEPLTRYTAGEMMSVLAKLALFADAEGYPAKAEVWLSRELIERFVLVGTAVSTATKANYRSKLLRLREAVVGGDCKTGKPAKLSGSTMSKPYSAPEINALWSWATGQPTAELRAGCKALLALGRGCGLDSHEVISLRAYDIRRPADRAAVVAVRGRRERLVVCRSAWEGVLLEAAERLDDPTGYLFRPGVHSRAKNTVTNFLARTHAAPGAPALKMARLRASWLVELIETNVPLPVIVAAAGLDTLHGLSRVLPYVRGVAPAQASNLLRGDE